MPTWSTVRACSAIAAVSLFATSCGYEGGEVAESAVVEGAESAHPTRTVWATMPARPHDVPDQVEAVAIETRPETESRGSAPSALAFVSEVPPEPPAPVTTVVTTTLPPEPTTVSPVTATPTPPPAAAPAPAPAPAPPTTVAPPPTTPPPPATPPPPPPTTAPPAPAAPALSPGAEAEMVGLVNGVRASLGLAALARNGDLDGRARAWAMQMAASGQLSHSSNIGQLVGAPWSRAAENVGRGGDVGAIHAALISSAGHYNNIVDPGVTQIGVGVAVAADGGIWVTQLFAG